MFTPLPERRWYILNGHQAVEVSWEEHLRWIVELPGDTPMDIMRVAQQDVVSLSGKVYRVSTVFLHGVDYNFGFDPTQYDPILFETMVFEEDNGHECHCERCSTWEQAEAQHVQIVTKVQAGEIPEP